MSTPLIALVGRKGSGKDTFARLLIEEAKGADVCTHAFAKPLKDFCQTVFSFTHAQLWGPSELRDVPDERYGTSGNEWDDAWMLLAKHGPPFLARYLPAVSMDVLRAWYDALLFEEKLTPRRPLETLGTELGRAADPDVWARAGVRYALEMHDHGATVVLTDCRFANEAAAVQAAGGAVVRISRMEADRVPATHSSEKEMDSGAIRPDYLVRNDGTLADLRVSAAELLVFASSHSPIRLQF